MKETKIIPEDIERDWVPLWASSSEYLIPFIEEEIRVGSIGGKDKITYKYLLKKYQKYCFYWQIKYGTRDPKFIGKNDEMLSPAAFLQDKHYYKAWDMPKKLRDFYLFGEHSLDDLEDSLENFLKRHNR